MPSSETPTLPFAPRIDSIDSWLSDLPVTNTRECCRVLYDGLRALNDAPLEPQLRFQALERFRPLVSLQARNLVPYFVGKPLPLGEKIHKLAKLSAQFHAELAKGYQAIAHGGFADDFSEEARSTIIHRALRSYQLYLLHIALIYETPSRIISANGLYQLAERMDIHKRPVSESDLGSDAASSVDAVFKRISAFRLVAPNRLSHEDIRQSYDVLQQYGELIHIGRNPNESNERAACSIDLSSSEPPCVQNRNAGDRENVRYLFFGRLIGKLEALSQPSVPSRSRLAASLSVYLQVRLGAVPPQLPEQKMRNAVLIVGFDHLVRTLATIMLTAENQASWVGASKLELLPLNDHVGLGTGPELSKSVGSFATSVSKPVRPYSEVECRVPLEGESPCRVYRTEAPGYYLLDHGAGNLHAGSLVGLNTDNKLIQVGLVCSGRHESAPLYCGFELLASDVTPVRIYRDAAPQVGYKALFTNGTCAGKQGLGLITLPLRLRSGDWLKVELDGRRESYRIAKVLESSTEFCHFEIAWTGDAADR